MFYTRHSLFQPYVLRRELDALLNSGVSGTLTPVRALIYIWLGGGQIGGLAAALLGPTRLPGAGPYLV